MTTAAPADAAKTNSKFSETALNSIWRERVKSEMVIHSLNEDFNVNPFKVVTVAEKPNQRDKRFLDRDEALLKTIRKQLNKGKVSEEEQSTISSSTLSQARLYILVFISQNTYNSLLESKFFETLKKARSAPTEKYPYPQTAAHEYGWFSKPLMDKQRFNHKHVSCAETIFGEVLVRTGGVSKKAETTQKK